MLGEGRVEGGDSPSAVTGEMGEPGIGDLAVAKNAGGIDFEVTESVVPEDVVGMSADRTQARPSRFGPGSRAVLEVYTQERALGNGAGGERQGFTIKPSQGAGMMGMFGDRHRA